MLKLVCGAAAVALMAAPALAQEKGEYRNPKPLTAPDMSILQEAIDTVGANAECETKYVIGTDAMPKDIVPNCTDPAFDPYVVRAIESMTFQSEIFDGELFDSEPLTYPFRFGVQAASSSGQQPKVVTNVNGGDISRAINRVDEEGMCNVEFVVGVDGKPKDIEPNCDPSKYDRYIVDIIAKTEYEPGTKNGEPADWPMSMPLKLSKPD